MPAPRTHQRAARELHEKTDPEWPEQQSLEVGFPQPEQPEQSQGQPAPAQPVPPPHQRSTAGGFVNGVGSLGQVTSPLLVSAVVRMAEWDALFYVFTGVALLGGVALAWRWNAKVEIWHAA